MTITNGYTTVSTLKGDDLLHIGATDTSSDSLLEAIIEAASRAIDADCMRYFYQSATDETKYFSPEFCDELFLPVDIVSITSLATDDSDDRTYPDTWTSADYDLSPEGASDYGRPYTSIVTRPNGDHDFPTSYRKSVKIVGIFGWPSVPKKIETACILLSMRLFKRMSTPLGVASMAATGEVQVMIRDKDADYWHLLSEFIRKV